MIVTSTQEPIRASLRSVWMLLLPAALLLLLFGARGSSRSDLELPPPEARARVASSIDVFSASPAELQFLPGIGKGIARSMHHGIRVRGVRTLDELERLSGIGPARATAIRKAVGGAQ